MAKVAGGIDATVKYVETVIATLPTFTFRNTSGKEMPIRDLAGLARSVQAATAESRYRPPATSFGRAHQVVCAYAGGTSATAASVVRRRKVNVSCRYKWTAVSVWFE
jgi:hypothetical protein